MKYISDFSITNEINKSMITNSKLNISNKIIKGGHLEEEDRLNYLRLCFKLKQSYQDYRSITEKLLQYLANYVGKLLEKLPPMKTDLYTKIFSILKKPLEQTDKAENFLAIINIVSLQCVILLTDASKEARRHPDFMLYIADPYNDPSMPKEFLLDEAEAELNVNVEFYDMSLKELQELSDEELNDLTDEIISDFDEEELDEQLLFYNVDNSDQLKTILIRTIKRNKRSNNVFYTPIFDKLIDCVWTDYNTLKRHIIETPVLLNMFSSLIYLNTKTKEQYTFPLKKNSIIFLAVILGEMTLSELLIASSNNIYFLGVVSENTNADGYRYNPFLFFYHDIDHSNGDINDRQMYKPSKISLLNKKIISFITLYNKRVKEHSITKEKYNNIMFWLFLLAHEFPNTIGLLLLKKEENIEELLNDLLKAVLIPFGNRYPYLFRFKNEQDLGGFIPVEYRGNIHKIVENVNAPMEDGINTYSRKPNSYSDNFMEHKNVPLFFKISVVDFATAWYSPIFIPKNRKISKRRSNSYSKSKLKSKQKTRKSI